MSRRNLDVILLALFGCARISPVSPGMMFGIEVFEEHRLGINPFEEHQIKHLVLCSPKLVLCFFDCLATIDFLICHLNPIALKYFVTLYMLILNGS